jgi:hypothetical protein
MSAQLRERSPQYPNVKRRNFTQNLPVKSYGASASYNGTTIEISGCDSPEQAARVLARTMILEGWKLREHPWQFWRPIDPRG